MERWEEGSGFLFYNTDFTYMSILLNLCIMNKWVGSSQPELDVPTGQPFLDPNPTLGTDIFGTVRSGLLGSCQNCLPYILGEILGWL